MGFLYRITSPSGKFYIGITVQSVSKRWWSHCREACVGSNTPLHRAIRKYGADAFEVRTLAVLEDTELAATEIRAIERMQPEYNVTAGGDGTLGVSPSAETRAKLSAALRGRKKSAEHRAKLSAANRGKKLSAEHRANVGFAQRGRQFSDEHRKKLAAASRRLWQDPKHRAKVRKTKALKREQDQ